MRIITSNPILTKSSSNDEFYSLDATSPKSEIKAFQDWLDAKGLKWVKATNIDLTNGSKLNKGGGYGTFGPSTTKAFARYGQEWLATQPSGSGASSDDKPKDDKPKDDKPKDDTPKDENKKEEEGIINKFKAMSTTKKVLVVALPIVVVIAAIVIMKRIKK
jgi:hypothetical protein